MAERELQWRLSLEGVERSLQQIKTLEDRVRTLEGATKANTAATRLQVTQTQALGAATVRIEPSIKSVSGSLGKVGGALRTAAPLVGQFAGQLGQAGGAAGQLGGVVSSLAGGFGPLGIAIGVASGFITTLISLVIEAKTEMDNLSRASVGAAASFEDVREAIRGENAAAARESRRATGTESAEDTLALVRTLEHRRDLANVRRINAEASGADSQQILAIKREIAALNRDIETQSAFFREAQEAEAAFLREDADNANDPPEDGGGRGGRGRGGSGRGVASGEADMSGLIGRIDSVTDAENARRVATETASGDRLSAIAEDQNRQRELAAEREAALKEETSWQKELGDAGVKAAVETSEAWQAALDEVGGLFDSVYSRAVSGEMSFGEALKQGTKVWLQQFGIKQGKMALAAIAEGTGLLFIDPPAAANKFAAAALHGALAAGAAVGASAMGGGRSAGAPAAQSRDRVLGSGVRDSGRGGGNTYVINVGTFAVGTKADVGREVLGAIEAANRHDGPRA